MFIDIYRDVKQPRRHLAVTSGDWPLELVPVGQAGVQLFDYMLADRAVDLAVLERRGDSTRLRTELAGRGYAFFTALDVVAQGAAAPSAESEVEALLRRAQMLKQAAVALRDEAVQLGRAWSEDVDGLAAALKLERMTEGLADRTQTFPLAHSWLSDTAA